MGRGRGTRVREDGRVRLGDERAAVSTEFALLLVLVALVLIAAVTAFGLSVGDLLDQGTSGVDRA